MIRIQKRRKAKSQETLTVDEGSALNLLTTLPWFAVFSWPPPVTGFHTPTSLSLAKDGLGHPGDLISFSGSL